MKTIIENIPLDVILYEILVHLSFEDCWNFLSTNKYFQSFINCSPIIKMLLIKYTEKTSTPSYIVGNQAGKWHDGNLCDQFDDYMRELRDSNNWNIGTKSNTRWNVQEPQDYHTFSTESEKFQPFFCMVSPWNQPSSFIEDILEEIIEEVPSFLDHLDDPLEELINLTDNEQIKEFIRLNESQFRIMLKNTPLRTRGGISSESIPIETKLENITWIDEEYKKSLLGKDISKLAEEIIGYNRYNKELEIKYQKLEQKYRKNYFVYSDEIETDPIDRENLVDIFKKGKKFVKYHFGHITYCLNRGIKFSC